MTNADNNADTVAINTKTSPATRAYLHNYALYKSTFYLLTVWDRHPILQIKCQSMHIWPTIAWLFNTKLSIYHLIYLSELSEDLSTRPTKHVSGKASHLLYADAIRTPTVTSRIIKPFTVITTHSWSTPTI